MAGSGPFGWLTSAFGERDARDDIADYQAQQLTKNRAAAGLDPDGNPLPPPPPGGPAAPAGGTPPVQIQTQDPSQTPNAHKTPQDLGTMLMRLGQQEERNQGFNQALGMGFAAFAQPRDREMVSKMFNTNLQDPNKLGETLLSANSAQAGQDQTNAIRFAINDPQRGPLIAQKLHVSWEALKTMAAADPGAPGKIAAQLGMPSKDLADLTQLGIMGGGGAGGAAGAGQASSPLGSLTQAVTAKIGGPSGQMINDEMTYHNKYGVDPPWKDNQQAYNQYVADQKSLSDSTKAAQDILPGAEIKAVELQNKLNDLKTSPDLKEIIEAKQGSPVKVIAAQALADKDPDWQSNALYTNALSKGQLLAISELKEITGQEYGNVVSSLTGSGLRPSTVEVQAVREGMGQTKNISNFSSMKDFKSQALDPLTDQIENARAGAYGAAQAFKSMPESLRPLVHPIYLPGGNLNQEGSGSEGWYKSVNRPLAGDDLAEVKAAIAANPGDAKAIRAGLRKKGYQVDGF